MVGDAPKEPLPAAPHQHDSILLGELEERRLDHGDVSARLGVEALEERGLRLVEVRQLFLEQSITMGRIGDQLVIDKAVAEPLRQLLPNLGSARSHLVRDRDDGHGSHSFRYLALSAAGAIAIRLPATSSRTYTSSARVPLAKTSKTCSTSSSAAPGGCAAIIR